MPAVIAPFAGVPQQPPNGGAKLNCQVSFFTSRFLSIKRIRLLQKGPCIFYGASPSLRCRARIQPPCPGTRVPLPLPPGHGGAEFRHERHKGEHSGTCICFKQPAKGKWRQCQFLYKKGMSFSPAPFL